MHIFLTHAFCFYLLFFQNFTYPQIIDQKMSSPLSYTPNNTIIAFDIHGVLLKLDTHKLIKTALVELIKSPLLPFYVAFDIICGKNILQRTAVRRLANNQKPIAESWEIVKCLKNAGYQLLIFSNIETTTFQELCNKLPHYFDIFDETYTVSLDHEYLPKPHPEAYTSFKAKFMTNQLSNIIFIDDKQENVRAAEKEGFVGIIFSTPEQLQQQLVDLQVLSYPQLLQCDTKSSIA